MKNSDECHVTSDESERPMADVLRGYFATRKLVYQDEKELQQIIADTLTENQILFVREFLLGKNDRGGSDIIDFFMFATGTGIEVKVDGSMHEHLRQLHRYAQHPAVKTLILVCPKPWALPATLNNKPLFRVALFGSLI